MFTGLDVVTRGAKTTAQKHQLLVTLELRILQQVSC